MDVGMRQREKAKITEAPRPAKILVIEDEPNMVAGLRENFELCGHEVITASPGGIPRPCGSGCHDASDEWTGSMQAVTRSTRFHPHNYADCPRPGTGQG